MEELKVIMQTLATLGAEAKVAFIWYMAFKHALPVIGWASSVSAICYAVYKVAVVIAGYNERTNIAESEARARTQVAEWEAAAERTNAQAEADRMKFDMVAQQDYLRVTMREIYSRLDLGVLSHEQLMTGLMREDAARIFAKIDEIKGAAQQP